MRGLYIHIPFCVHKCAYCDFYSLANQGSLIEPYIRAVLCEAEKYHGLSFQTLYLGGGTPGLLGADYLKVLLNGLGGRLDLTDLEEATMEANPESATADLLDAAKKLGISRLSIGVQSLSDYELRSVGRIHTAAQATEAVSRAKRAGFSNISADLIIGLPGQSWQTLKASLKGLAALGVQHLSLYCLSVEPNTPLASNIPGDLPSDDMQAELYERARLLLSVCGFIHYEISNFALEGRECQHNLNYWRGGEYIGLGAAAASHFNRKRFKNRPDLHAYLEDPKGLVEEEEELDIKHKAAEEAMLRLRLLSEGLNTAEFTACYGQEDTVELYKRLDKLVNEKSIVQDGPLYRLAPARVLTSNPVFAAVLED